MTEGTSLDDLLNDTEAQVSEPVIETEVEGPRDDDSAEKGVTAEPETATHNTTVTPTDKLPKEEYKAVKEEREKRQSLEREVEALKNRMQQLSQPQHDESVPTIWEDEEAAFQYRNNQVVEAAVYKSSVNAKLDMSEMLARQTNPDFDEVRAEFLALAEANPQLAQQALNDPHPWDKAYRMAKNHRAMQDLGATNIDDLRAKLREDILAEMQGGQEPVRQQALPPTLTGERSVAARTGPAWGGPTPLEDLLR